MEKQTTETGEVLHNPHESGNFLNGLLTGVLLGAAGYYLFGTEKGKKLKDELIQAAKDEFPEIKEVLSELREETIAAVKTSKPVKEVKQAVEKKLEEKLDEKLPEVKEEMVEKLQHLEDSIVEAKKKADQMQRDLEKAASRIERKFFVRKGRSLKK